MKKELICCICGRKIERAGVPDYFGNNPDGAAWKTPDGKIEFPEFQEDDRCCDECDNRYVIPGRIYKLQLSRQNQDK